MQLASINTNLSEVKMKYEETSLTKDLLDRLIQFSKDWESENSCYGYIANSVSDIEGNRIFVATDDGNIIGYLFGHISQSKNMKSIMPEGTPFFEIEELYVVPQFRSQGVGSSLFSFAVTQIKETAEYAVLSTATKNWKAILHFYIEELGMEFWSARLYKKL